METGVLSVQVGQEAGLHRRKSFQPNGEHIRLSWEVQHCLVFDSRFSSDENGYKVRDADNDRSVRL